MGLERLMFGPTSFRSIAEPDSGATSSAICCAFTPDVRQNIKLAIAEIVILVFINGLPRMSLAIFIKAVNEATFIQLANYGVVIEEFRRVFPHLNTVIEPHDHLDAFIRWVRFLLHL